MEISEEELRNLKKAFSDICRGYSVDILFADRVYVKHLSHHDQTDLDVIYKKFFEKAKERKIPTYEEMFEILSENSIWTKQDESDIQKQRSYLEHLVEGKKHLYLKSRIEERNELIKEEEIKLQELLEKKSNIFGVTAEIYAERKMNESYIAYSIFRDKNFTKPFFSENKIENISEEEVKEVITFYNNITKNLEEDKIKQIVLQNFFLFYWNSCENNIFNFFGKPICEASLLQIKLGSYARIFSNILENHSNIPEDIRSDPNKLLDYANAANKGKENLEKHGGDNAATSLVGATKEDYKNMGYDSKNSVSLSEKMKEKEKQNGGESKGLNMHDLIEMMGS